MSTLSYTLGLDSSQFRRGVDDAKKSISELKSTGGGMEFPFVNKLSAGLDVAKTVVSATAGAVRALKRELDEFSAAAAAIEDTSVALKAFTGDARLAAKAAAQVVKFAATPPFGLEETREAAKLLLATGTEVENLTTELTVMGNVAAAGGFSISELGRKLSKSSEQGYVSFMELRSLLSSGIPIVQALADVLGVPKEEIRAMAEEGSISVANLKAALNSLGGAGGKFATAMEDIGKTTNGLKQSISGAVTEIKEILGAPLNDLLRPFLEDKLEMVRRVRDELGVVVQMMQDAQAAGDMGELIKDGISWGVGEGINYIGGMFDYAAKLAKIFFTGSAEEIDAVFGLGTTEVFKAAFDNAGKMVGWLGMLVLTELSNAFLNVAKTFHAALEIGMDWLIRKLMDALELVGVGSGGGEGMTWKQAMHDSGKVFDGLVKDTKDMQKVTLNGIRYTAEDCLTSVKDVVEAMGWAFENASYNLEFKKQDIIDTSAEAKRLSERREAAAVKKKEKEEENKGTQSDRMKGESRTAQAPALKQGGKREPLYTKEMQMRDQLEINRAIGTSTFTKATRLGTEAELKSLTDKWSDVGKSFGEASAYAAEDMKQNAKAQLAMNRQGAQGRWDRLQERELRKQAAGVTPAQKEALKKSKDYQLGTELDKYNMRQQKRQETKEKRNNQKPETPKQSPLESIKTLLEGIKSVMDQIGEKFELA